MAGANKKATLVTIPSDFIGREKELQMMRQFVAGDKSNNPGPRSRVKLIYIHGGPGVGKSSFAKKAAYDLADVYPDAFYSVDFQQANGGYISLREAYSGVIRSAVATGSLPTTEVELKSYYDSLFVGKRTILLLENAKPSLAQPMVPFIAKGTCLILMTSRKAGFSEIGGVPALELVLSPLSTEDGVKLLRSFVANINEEVAAAIVAKVAGLPMALRFCGSSMRRGQSAEAILTLLQSESSDYMARLFENVVISVFDHNNSAAFADKGRFLGLLTHSFLPAAAQAVCGWGYTETLDLLGNMLEAQALVWDEVALRYSQNELMRKYFRSLLNGQEQQAGKRRHLQYFLSILHSSYRDFTRSRLLAVKPRRNPIHTFTVSGLKFVPLKRDFAPNANFLLFYKEELPHFKSALRYSVELRSFKATWKLAILVVISNRLAM
jgi:hypothetical protein